MRIIPESVHRRFTCRWFGHREARKISGYICLRCRTFRHR